MVSEGKRLVFCLDCGECLGAHSQLCARDHIKKHPTHDNFLVKTILDPLLLSNPDEWFKRHSKFYVRTIYQPRGNTEKTTDNETEPVLWFCQINGTSPKYFSL